MSSFDDDKIILFLHPKRIIVSFNEDELLEPSPLRRIDISSYDNEPKEDEVYFINNECQIYVFNYISLRMRHKILLCEIFNLIVWNLL